MKSDYKLFQQEIAHRGIQYLVHFTPTVNLMGMCETGAIMSRKKLIETDAYFQELSDYIAFTDEVRLEGKDFINTSIQHPNDVLFPKFRERTKEDIWKTWCVLLIDPKYIYADDTLFSVTNAANRHNREKIGITGDIDKFKMMFSDNLPVIASNYSRVKTRCGLISNMPTDVQAEVLIRENIPLNDILSVVFETEEDMVATREALPIYLKNMKVDKSFFLPRLLRI